MSRCPNQECKSVDGFQAVKANISNLDFPYLFIQCVSCGTVVGTTEANYTPEVLQQLATKLKVGPLS